MLAPGKSWYVASVAAAVVALAFMVAVAAGMRRSQLARFLEQSPLTPLKQSLRATPKNEALQAQLRQRDVETRRSVFERLTRTERGAWLLVTGLAVFLVSAHAARHLRRTLPDPKAWGVRAPEQNYRWAVVVCWGVLVAGALALRSPPPMHVVERTDEARRQWPYFRGPTGQGIATRAPTNFVVKWKTPVPLPGMSSPIVWKNRVFLTGADQTSREIFAFDVRTGALVWRQAVQTPVSGRIPEVMHDTGYAAPTPVTDGRRVYAIFANGDCAAVTTAGKPVWGRNLGLPDNPYGHASSLALFQDRLLVLLAQRESKSKVFGLDTKTGNAVWHDEPLVAASWISPIVVAGRLIIAADPEVIAYDALTGKEVWSTEAVEGELATSPVMAGDKLIVVSPSAKVTALTNGVVVWENDEVAPDIASPVSDGTRVYVIVNGTLSALDAATGEKLAEQDLEANFHASPVWCDGRLYLFSDSGRVLMLDAALTTRATLDLGEPIHATPAFVEQRIYVRTETQLICLGEY
jgi:outer membrane protein assembly factor BamB